MARIDDIFTSFMQHELISEKYGIKNIEIPERLLEGLNSEHVIIKAIALIVKNTESNSSVMSDRALYSLISQYLSGSAI